MFGGATSMLGPGLDILTFLPGVVLESSHSGFSQFRSYRARLIRVLFCAFSHALSSVV